MKLDKTKLKDILKISDSAATWLVALYDTIQILDDIMDKDNVFHRDDIFNLTWNTLYALHQNSFYANNMHLLMPLIVNAIIKWQAANNAEMKNEATPVSFVWRAGFFDIVLQVYLIEHGKDQAAIDADMIMNLYAENLDDYLKEQK